jgi:hypothetical protein
MKPTSSTRLEMPGRMYSPAVNPNHSNRQDYSPCLREFGYALGVLFLCVIREYVRYNLPS